MSHEVATLAMALPHRPLPRPKPQRQQPAFGAVCVLGSLDPVSEQTNLAPSHSEGEQWANLLDKRFGLDVIVAANDEDEIVMNLWPVKGPWVMHQRGERVLERNQMKFYEPKVTALPASLVKKAYRPGFKGLVKGVLRHLKFNAPSFKEVRRAFEEDFLITLRSTCHTLDKSLEFEPRSSVKPLINAGGFTLSLYREA